MKITITGVTKENLSAFMELAPAGILTDDMLDARHAIGALTGKRGEFVPVGLLIFDIGYSGLEKRADEPPSINLLWLYVSEDQRSKGVGKELLAKLYSIADSSGIKEIRCRLTAPDPENIIKSFLSGSGFEISEVERVSLTRPISAYFSPEGKKDASGADYIRSISELSPEELESIPGLFGESPKILDEDGRLNCESTVSCVLMHKDKISGILLSSSERRLSDDWRLKYTFIRILPQVPAEKIRMMLRSSFSKALELYGPDTPVHMESEYPPSVKLIKYTIKDCPTEKLLIGSITEPSPD